MTALLTLLACKGCDEPEMLAPPPATELPDIVWVTLDTTRADYIGAYGGGDHTPVFDGLAARGVRFDWMLTHVPATLASHSSMFTGLDTHGHGVPSNGYELDVSNETLAERMASLGYDPIAVIGASVLESAMGLDQGFRVYDDKLGDEKKRRYEDTADVVNQRVWAALEDRDQSRPLFLWVHYFDAHAPYEAPAEWQERYAGTDYTPSWGEGPFESGDTAKYEDLTRNDMAFVRDSYRAEVAWQDHNLGELVAGLEERGLMEALVVMADHGDLMGDPPDLRFGHASTVSFPVSRIPAFLIAPGVEPGVIERGVGSSDMVATLLAALGLETLGTGHDLLATTQQFPVFIEATKPKKLANKAKKAGVWNNLYKRRAVLYEDIYFVNTPSNDGEQVYAVEPVMRRTPGDKETIEAARDALNAWDEAAPPFREDKMNSATKKALEALGYL